MNFLSIPFFIWLTIYGFTRKREYVLAIILVGHPLLKLMANLFPNNIDGNIILLIYFSIGFLSLAIVRMLNRKPVVLNPLTRKYLLIYFIVCLIMAISLAYTPNKASGINKILEFITISFLITILSIVTITDEQSFYNSMKAIGNVSIIIGLITIIAVYLNTGGILVRIGSTKAQDIKILGINFAVSIWFGRRTGIGFISMLFMTLIDDNNRKHIIKTIILMMMVILSGSRGPILSMIIAAFIIISYNVIFINVNRKKFGKLLIILFGVLTLIAIFIINYKDSKLTRLISIKDSNVTSRYNMYLYSLNLIKQNLLGHGIGSFETLSRGLHRYPHNIILEICVELGLHTVLLLFLDVYLTFKVFVLYSNRYLQNKYLLYLNYCFSVFLFAILNAQFSGSIVSNEYIWFAFILMGQCVGIINKTLNIETKHFKY